MVSGMPSGAPAATRCELRADADLLAALDEHLIEHLDGDASRTSVCYRMAVLDLRVTGGRLPRPVRVRSPRRDLPVGD